MLLKYSRSVKNNKERGLMNKLLLATDNIGKITELTALLKPLQCLPQSAFKLRSPKETGLSFIENAILKARFASAHSQMPALADDSGLVVHALHGAPGIYSARFAGPHASDNDNRNYLLNQLATCLNTNKEAYFYCAIALVQYQNDPTPLIATGACYGLISDTPTGSHGFGYDPIFYLPDYGCTMAELPLHLKNKISHRANALKKLTKELSRML